MYRPSGLLCSREWVQASNEIIAEPRPESNGIPGIIPGGKQASNFVFGLTLLIITRCPDTSPNSTL